MSDDPKFYYRLVVGTSITDREALEAHLQRMLRDVSTNSGGLDTPWEFEVFCWPCREMIGFGDTDGFLVTEQGRRLGLDAAYGEAEADWAFPCVHNPNNNDKEDQS